MSFNFGRGENVRGAKQLREQGLKERRLVRSEKGRNIQEENNPIDVKKGPER